MRWHNDEQRVVTFVCFLVFLLLLLVVYYVSEKNSAGFYADGAAVCAPAEGSAGNGAEVVEPVQEPALAQVKSLVLRKTTHAAAFTSAPKAEMAAEPMPNYAAEAQKELDLMCESCLNGDYAAGRAAGERRNALIDSGRLADPGFAFDELLLLSKLITAEAGSSWLGDDWRLRVGEVLLNRIDSPEFPDTMEEVLYQPEQYYSRENRYFQNLIPYDYCVEAARRLLCGERLINDPSVVFQANFIQGSGIYLCMEDKLLGNTYLCYSSHPEYYGGND